MNKLARVQWIQEEELDSEFYFQSLFNLICSRQLLEASEIGRIQVELSNLLGKETERYTGGESSSVKIETAQGLLQSICYQISMYLKSIPCMEKKLEVINKEKVSELFYHGMDRIISSKKEAQILLEQIQGHALRIENIAYQDTIFHGIVDFFHDYNIEFAAQDNPGSIDYPLCRTIERLTGIEFISEYLKRLWIENEFCLKFDPDKIQCLLNGFHKENVEMLINIFELIFTNALGCTLVGNDCRSLNIRPQEMTLLQNMLEGKSTQELQSLFTEQFYILADSMEIDKDREYFISVIPELVIRIKHNLKLHRLDRLFISFPEEGMGMEYNYLEEGILMEDEMLRKLIEELRACRYVSDKIELLRREVQSLSDMVELLEECFYGDELLEVYKNLSFAELEMLRKRIEDDQNYMSLYGDSELKEWQQKLLDYGRSHYL